MLRFATTIFLSAFLLFQVQPLIAKYILPWFGGTSGVWTTCMLFFQMVLLVGYAYAHFLGRFAWRKQAIIHLVMLGIALIFMPIEPSADWRPVDGSAPTLRILLLLAATLGMPYMLVSSTGPLLQNWFSATYPGRSPYRLYSLSNFGSLLALLTFPIWIETNLSRQMQVISWSVGFGVFALCCAWCAWKMLNLEATATKASSTAPAAAPAADLHPDFERQALLDPIIERKPRETGPSIGVILLWLFLSASGSAMLLATTNQLTAEVAVVPFLWIIPLSLYLITFIICFDNERWYSRAVFGPLALIALPVVIVLLHEGVHAELWLQIVGYSGCMFAMCMLCHGELVRAKPNPKYLTLFYLLISAGGALGGLCVAVLAPMTLSGYYEYHIALGFAALVIVIAWWRSSLVGPKLQRISIWPFAVTAGAGFVAAALVLLLTVDPLESIDDAVAAKFEDMGSVARFLDTWREYFHVVITDPKAFPNGKSYFAIPSAAIGFILLAFTADRLRVSWNKRPFFSMIALSVLPFALMIALYKHVEIADREAIFTTRNFYGVLHVEKDKSYSISVDDGEGGFKTEDLGPQHKLVHGRIMHGHQFINDAPQRRWHTSYYGRESGVGIAIEEHPRRSDPDPALRSLHIGSIGLGTGTTASYGRKGDKVRIYEINPAVEEIARKWFYYLGDCQAELKVVLGDARVMLERELERGEVQHFDVLAVDAFSSDAIPVHLLTKECGQMYFKHLKPDGILALHISNRFIDLKPVTYALAKELNCKIVLISNSADSSKGVSSSSWVLLTRNEAFAKAADEDVNAEPWWYMETVTEQYLATLRGLDDEKSDEVEVGKPNPHLVRQVLWTDDFASLWELLDF